MYYQNKLRFLFLNIGKNPWIFVLQKILAIHLIHNCFIILRLISGFNISTFGSKVYTPIMCITFPVYISVVSLFSGIYFSCILALLLICPHKVIYYYCMALVPEVMKEIATANLTKHTIVIIIILFQDTNQNKLTVPYLKTRRSYVKPL